jgi:phenylpropionate dioxygenase-like ring-hydroxylating dioxygenase large terminal subunit
MLKIKDFVNVKNATQSRQIFGDPEIYQLELERVFARCWLFLTHESLIPNIGDFVTTKMGEDEVIVWRQRDKSIKAFLNVCTHRGMKLCMAEAGNAKGLSCGYHGWAFGVEGNLDSVPVEEALYGPDFDRCTLGLREVPLVESHRGFVFACMDGAAPTLKDYLGDAAWYMDVWADVPGGVELVGPPSRSIIHANWKSPAENFIGDVYHVAWTHASALYAAAGVSVPQAAFAGENMGFQATMRYGHGVGVNFTFPPAVMLLQSCPEMGELLAQRHADLENERGPKVAKLVMGQWDAGIFPNCSYLIGTNIFKVWHPIGPDKVEIMTWTIVEKDMPDDLKRRIEVVNLHTFGTAGILESDDIDNFEYATKPNRGYVTRQGWLNCQMALGQERGDADYPGVVTGSVSEIAHRGFYRFYADCLEAKSWQELEAVTATWKQDILGKK